MKIALLLQFKFLLLKKLPLLLFLLFASAISMSFAHKFYVAIFQINHNSDKKTIEITTRIFVDDLNNALSKRYSTKTHLAEATESSEDIALMNKYLQDKFRIKINGRLLPYQFVSKEVEGGTIICYYKIPNIPNVKEIDVRNTTLIDWNDEQQNIIQLKVGDEKQSMLLKDGDSTGSATFGQ